MNWAWWILFLPLISFLIIPLVPEKNRTLAGWLACFTIFVSFLLSLKLALPLFQGKEMEAYQITLPWITLPDLKLELGLLIDPLSILMLLVVTGVGSLIFFYSLEYMGHDEGYRRYFTGLSIFAFSMIGIVLSSNLLQLFIFWELVGLSSYLLIGHWYQKPEAVDAGKKAFLTNRVGDFGFLIGILILWTLSGPLGARTLNIPSLGYSVVKWTAFSGIHEGWLVLAMLLIFAGVMGKSAQFPLHVWLPDAMEGPTPVSALIHAATMVAAGIYLLARTFSLYLAVPSALEIIAYIGGFTALFAATQAVVQKDIKRILAYSTLSQLGYMVMAIGLGSSVIGMYHLTTHAFFKALLFLGAGSIIHATHEQNIFQMGGLVKKMPFTSITFLVGAFALVGFWPSSGFFSKDEILALAVSENKTLFVMSMFTAYLTALYVGRLVIVAFFSPSKSKSKKKLHEPSLKITAPLGILAFFSLTAGFFGIDKMLAEPRGHHATHPDLALIILITLFGILGISTAFVFYRLSENSRKKFQEKLSFLHQILERKYYIDDLYNWILRHIQEPLAQVLSWFEKKIVVEGVVNHSAHLTVFLGRTIRKLQNGRIQTYLSVFLTGVVVLIYIMNSGFLK
jgi:NADH-quinone oxidoreductase subunit L